MRELDVATDVVIFDKWKGFHWECSVKISSFVFCGFFFVHTIVNSSCKCWYVLIAFNIIGLSLISVVCLCVCVPFIVAFLSLLNMLNKSK